MATPLGPTVLSFSGGLNADAAACCEEVNTAAHSEICAIPAGRLASERELLGGLPSLRLDVGPRPITRKVDKLSCIRFGSARYSVPNRLIGAVVTVLVDERDRMLRVVEPVTDQVHAEHAWSRPVRPASSMLTTTGRVLIPQAGERHHGRRRNGSSWRWGRSPRSSWSARPPRA